MSGHYRGYSGDGEIADVPDHPRRLIGAWFIPPPGFPIGSEFRRSAKRILRYGPAVQAGRCRIDFPSSAARIEDYLSKKYLFQIWWVRSEEHTSELQSRRDLVCRLLLEK